MSTTFEELADFGTVRTGGRVKIALKLMRNESGYEYVDIRRWEDFGGTWKPTGKGVTLPPDRLTELVRLLEAAQGKLVVQE